MIDSEHKPIKRSPFLAPLSREHHEGLLLAWKIQQGIRKGVDLQRIVRYCNWFFKEFLAAHFQTEEKTFSKILAADHPLLVQLMNEHREIEKAVNHLSHKTMHQEVELLDFGTLLQLHIRFEERFLFNHIESILSADELKNLDIHAQGTAKVWEDTFWL